MFFRGRRLRTSAVLRDMVQETRLATQNLIMPYFVTETDDAMNSKGIKPASCDIDIANHYALGVQFGVNGTPAIVLSDGNVVPGYQGPKEMKAFLDEHQKQTGGK